MTLYEYVRGQAKSWIFTQKVLEVSEPRKVNFSLPKASGVERICLEVLRIYDKEPAHVHVWKVKTW